MIRAAGTILRKDLLLELRTREAVPAMTLFTITVYVLFHFGLDRNALDGDLASGVLWVTLLLASVIGVTRLFAAEREQGGIDALLLAPVDRTALFVAKASALFLFLVVVELVAVPAYDLIVPLMLLPLLLPLLISCAQATEPLMRTDQGPEDLGRWLGLLTLYDVVFVLVSVAVFDFLLED